MENAEDHLSDIETQLRALAAADAAPRAEDAALLERLMAKADAAAAAATRKPWYRSAGFWRGCAACIPIALVLGISYMAAEPYLPQGGARGAQVKQLLPEEPATTPVQYLPHTQADMQLPQGALVYVGAESAPGGAALTHTLHHHLTAPTPVAELALETEESTPVTMLPETVLPCAEDEEETMDDALPATEPVAGWGKARSGPALRTVATYSGGSEESCAEQPLAQHTPTPECAANTAAPRHAQHSAPRKKAAKKAAPTRNNIGTRLLRLFHRWQQDFYSGIKQYLPRHTPKQ